MSSKSDYRVKTQQQINKVHLRGGKDETIRLTCSVLFMLRGKQMSFTRAQISESGLQKFNRLYVWAQRFLKNQITLPRIAWEIKNIQLSHLYCWRDGSPKNEHFMFIYDASTCSGIVDASDLSRVYVTHCLHCHASAVVNTLRTV